MRDACQICGDYTGSDYAEASVSNKYCFKCDSGRAACYALLFKADDSLETIFKKLKYLTPQEQSIYLRLHEKVTHLLKRLEK